MFSEGPLQASSRYCVSLASDGEVEIINRMGPGAGGPPFD